MTGLEEVTHLALGETHVCARVTDGTVRCWGANGNEIPDGSLGIGPYSFAHVTAPRPVVGLSGVTQLAAGLGFTCAIRTQGPPVCWGINADGQLGNGYKTLKTTPTPVVWP